MDGGLKGNNHAGKSEMAGDFDLDCLAEGTSLALRWQHKDENSRRGEEQIYALGCGLGC